ncbi:MAG: hypothetical protein JSV90_06235 [Methanobacteriota archaeon]|nr:MAG: hypothetical protein JSV90_06235 [Euryarchaeota archaeon]
MPIDKRKMRLRVNARITSKVREKDLLAKAEALKEDYGLILPKCSKSCRACPFIRTRLHLERAAKVSDDPVKLAKLSRKGDKIARAYAATVGLAHDKKAPYLASARYPKGTVMFALRGKTPREKLIGVQNYDSPQWRVLSVLDLVKRGRLHFYSFGDSFICTGREPVPPPDYIRKAAHDVGATRQDGDRLLCPHDPEESDHVEFRWAGSELSVLLCDQCTVKGRNTLSRLAEGMAVPNVLDNIEVSVVRPLKDESGDCAGLLDRPVDRELLEEYSSGKISDRELIDKHMEDLMENLKLESRRVFVKGYVCYGADIDAFVGDMTDDQVEAKALKGLLEDIGHPVVVGSGETVNKLLSTHWKKRGRDSLRAVVSEALADKYFDDGEGTVASPMKSIRRAVKEAEREAAAAKMPRYRALSTYGRFVDDVARTYKTGGSSSAIALLDGETSSDHRKRSIVHAFNLSLGITTKEWKFTNEEREFGKHLKKFATDLLESEDPEEHHKAFTTFLREAGVTEEVNRS